MIKDNILYKILVVEDNVGDYVLVENMLQDVITTPIITNAPDFRSTCKILSSDDSAFDIVLLDLSLPDKSGQDLITAMLGLVKNCPIIILTGYGDIALSIKFISQGISDYLIKDDLNATTLYKSIIYAIERRNLNVQLKESEKVFSDLFYFSQQPTIVYDPANFKIVQANKATLDYLGYTEDEFLELTILDLKEDPEVERARENLKHINDDNIIINRQISRYKKKNGEVMDMEIFSEPIVLNNKNFRCIVAVNVTEKMLHEQRMLKAIIKTQEDERYEIGRELHDNVGQILITALINLGMLKKHINFDGIDWFEKTKESMNLAVKEVRNLSHRIAPNFADDTTFFEATKRLFSTFNADNTYEINLVFEDKAKLFPLNVDIQLSLYRILQEQLKNIIKYAKAQTIDLEVSIDNNVLLMSLTDDGTGFEKKNVNEGIGFANIKRRVEILSGTFEVFSSLGNGCRIQVRIPLQ